MNDSHAVAAQKIGRARGALESGDLAEALAIVEAVLGEGGSRHPDLTLQARQLAGVIERRRGRYGEARAHLEHALRIRPGDPHILNSLGNVLDESGDTASAIDRYRQAIAASSSHVDAIVNLALACKKAGLRDEARAALDRASRMEPVSVRVWHALGVMLLEEEDLEGAAIALDKALELEPGNRRALKARIEVELRAGGVATAFAARAVAVSPQDAEARFDYAIALHNDGRTAEAETTLAELVDVLPEMRNAQAALARIRWSRGAGNTFAAGYEAALARSPVPALWVDYLSILLRSGHAERVLQLVDAARGSLGKDVDQFEAVAATEAGAISRADAAFARCDLAKQPSLQVPYLRHLLRAGRIEVAAQFALHEVTPQLEPAARPYLATAWRLLRDPRWAWLEGQAQFIREVDLGIPDSDRGRLADVLRGLHAAGTKPLDQSLRGGTQTEGNLLLRREPEIAALKARFADAVADYIDALPADDTHPFLKVGEDGFAFTGAWSVRLLNGGHHVNHVHSDGWISSAFYVSLPSFSAADLAEERGWLKFGQPPEELSLGLAPFRSIEPRPGRLVLFPATLWHGTTSFGDGERLTVAFDVAPHGDRRR